MAATEPASALPVEPSGSANLVAWTAWLVPMCLTAVGSFIFLLTLDAPYPVDAWGFRGYSALFAVTSATVGAIVLARQPRNRIGRLMILVALLSGLQFLAEEYLAYGVVAHPGTLPTVEWVAWTTNWVWAPLFILVVAFFLIFPDGHLLSVRWRRVVWLAFLSGLATAVTAALLPGPLTDFPLVVNPLSIGGPVPFDILSLAARLGLFVSLALGAWSLVLRYQRADAVGRLQLRWVAYAAVIAALVSPLGFMGEEWAQALFIIALCGLPVAGGVAILHYHLYDVDLLINRTLVYVPLTAMLAGIYAASVALMQRVFVTVTREESDGAIVLTTLVVVMVFTPAKNGLQAVVDRHFKEPRDPRAQLAEFATLLESRLWRPDPEAVARRMLVIAVDALGASGGSISVGDLPPSRVGEEPAEPTITAWAGDGIGRVVISVGARPAGPLYSDQDRTALESTLRTVAAAISVPNGQAAATDT